MAISPDLFLAILAMDSYNRGYNAGLNITGNQIGTANLGIADNSTQAQAVSFFAQAYTLANGQKVISYRGTDSFSGDLATGYGLALGAPYGPQATMAIDFYKTVAGSKRSPDER